MASRSLPPRSSTCRRWCRRTGRSRSWRSWTTSPWCWHAPRGRVRDRRLRADQRAAGRADRHGAAPPGERAPGRGARRAGARRSAPRGDHDPGGPARRLYRARGARAGLRCGGDVHAWPHRAAAHRARIGRRPRAPPPRRGVRAARTPAPGVTRDPRLRCAAAVRVFPRPCVEVAAEPFEALRISAQQRLGSADEEHTAGP